MSECCLCWFSVGDLATKLEIIQTTLSHHHAILRDAGLVNSCKEGKQTLYTLNQENIVMRCGRLQSTVIGRNFFQGNTSTFFFSCYNCSLSCPRAGRSPLVSVAIATLWRHELGKFVLKREEAFRSQVVSTWLVLADTRQGRNFARFLYRRRTVLLLFHQAFEQDSPQS